ncbi:F-box protein At5g46170 [Impatiens glandulifera]|uniref:F-box protein At5g46170 n=1 Tax=Impatiens glandulifera TaxID=253017 RepID=UPI001FB19BF6|nr:F-box protein At5g46170 [Impatiens glandulifera]
MSCLDLTNKVYPESISSPSGIDHFDTLPDSILLLIFNKISDVKALGRCVGVSRRFQSLVLQVESIVVRVDCVISDDDPSSISGSADKSRNTFSTLFRLLFGGVIRPIQSLGQLLSNKRSISCSSSTLSADGDDDSSDLDDGVVMHHSPTQVLKNFIDIRSLKIELPSGELGIENGVLLKWRATFGSTLDTCVILGASSVIHPNPDKQSSSEDDDNINEDDHNGGSIPESFYTNGGLKLRVVWTISSLIAASARHYLLQPIINEHKTLEKVVLSDGDDQGVVTMNKEQLEELRVKPLCASSASKRTVVPALNMRLWYSPFVKMSDGTVLKGATLVAIRPSVQSSSSAGEASSSDVSWVLSAFNEPYGSATKVLVKKRTYCLEMNSF